MSEQKEYLFFFQDNTPFSNWFIIDFIKDNIKFCCTEQYMMYRKAVLFNDEEAMVKILKTKSPKMHKQYGRKVQNFDEQTWNNNREQIMIDGLYEKFSQNVVLKDYLVNTGDKILVEASPYDKVWGVGLSADNPKIRDSKNWKGLNLLGKSLMVTRDRLKE